MPENKLAFIDTKNSFKYSVNIRFDIGNFEKIDSYIPTAKNIKLFNETLDAFNTNADTSSYLLMGAYGTGKSMFGAVFGTLLSNKKDVDKYNKLLSKIERLDKNLAKRLKRELNNKDPYLMVLPKTESGNFKQSMLLGLEEALKKNDLNNILPNTYFDAVLDKLKQWASEYKNTYKEFINMLEKKRGENIDEFENRLNEYDQESYQFFVDVYPDLTSGGDFHPFYNASLEEIYKGVNREIRGKGYQGIYVIFDEFNKLLEKNIENFDGKELQDFAEMANNELEEIYFLLISHKKLNQYTSGLTEEQTNEWKKIGKRFKTLDASEYSSQIYELMSNVIAKKKEPWEKFKEKNKDKFKFYKDWINKLDIVPNYSKGEMGKYIVEGCYPLHPLTTILLPKLSQKVAQNERTIFTYLSTNEDNTLGEFITENSYSKSKFPLLRISSIYDYFEELMKQELDYTNLHQAWADSQRALGKIENNETEKKEFIKCLGIIKAVNNFSELPPSKELMHFALDYLEQNEFDQLVKELIEDKIILYRKSLDQFVFFEGSEIDFNKAIKEKKLERENDFYPKYLLQEHFCPAPIYPKEYNYEKKIRRYFTSEYLQLNNLKSIKDWNEYLVNYGDKNYEDGVLIYLLLESQEEIDEALDLIKNVDNKRVIFVIPKSPLEIEELLRNFEAQQLLKEDEEFLSQDSLAEQELDAYLNETKQLLSDKLNKFIAPYKQNSLYYNEGKSQPKINSKRDLSELVSEICDSNDNNGIFKKTPVINNELLIKDNISSPQKAGRKDIVQRLIFNEIEERLGIDGYRPNFLIYRTVLVNTNLLAEDKSTNDNEFRLNKRILDGRRTGFPKVGENLEEVIKKIIDVLYLEEGEVNFKEIYDELRKPPYGLRLGVIPILIVAAGRLNGDLTNIVIRHNGEEKEINAKLFERINRYPARYSIEKTIWSEKREEYISFLEEIFSKRLSNDNFMEVNRLKKVYIAMKSWYQSLSKYARETTDLSNTTLLFRNIIDRRSSEVKKILLDVIPNKLVGSDISSDNIDELKSKIKLFFKEHSQAYKNLIRELDFYIQDLFSEAENISLQNSLLNWYNELEDQAKNNTYSREVNFFLNLLRKLTTSEFEDEKLLNEISEIVTGFKVEDWNNNTVEEFKEKIEEIKMEVEKINANEDIDNEEIDNDDTYEFVLFDKTGQKYERRFEEVELDGISKILENKVKSNFEDVGPAVSDRAKQQILVNVLKEMFE